jgi:hypothetical protein
MSVALSLEAYGPNFLNGNERSEIAQKHESPTRCGARCRTRAQTSVVVGPEPRSPTQKGAKCLHAKTPLSWSFRLRTEANGLLRPRTKLPLLRAGRLCWTRPPCWRRRRPMARPR